MVDTLLEAETRAEKRSQPGHAAIGRGQTDRAAVVAAEGDVDLAHREAAPEPEEESPVTRRWSCGFSGLP